MSMQHPLQWFIDRVGKRVYRNKTSCKCKHCEEIGENGIIIRDKNHADYLYNIQMDFGAEGEDLNYRDKPYET